MMTGTLSSVLDGGPDPAFTARVRQSVASAQPRIEAHAANPAAVAPAARSSAGPSPAAWQVQVGAFRNAGAAQTHLRTLQGEIPELAGLTASHQRRGDVSRVRIGAIGDEAAARELCARLVAIGRGCFVVAPES